jgi:hypothetical protein
MILYMWYHRRLTGVLAQEISHMRQYLRLSTGTCGTRDMAPEIYHRRDEIIDGKGDITCDNIF